MDKRRMNSIATWVTEYEIYEYYQSIINDILSNKTVLKEFGDGTFDSDDIGLTRGYCDRIFYEITGENVYSALAAAYGYHKQSIKQKINREYKRADISARVIANDNKPNGLTDEEKDFAFQADFVRRVLNSKKRPPILPLNKRNHYITEKDIVTINQIIMNRTKRIYGDSTLSQISPALKKFYDYIADIHEGESEISVKTSEEPVEPKCEIKVAKPSDGEIIKNAVKKCVEIYDEQGCTNIIFESTLENGHHWELRLSRQWFRDNE